MSKELENKFREKLPKPENKAEEILVNAMLRGCVEVAQAYADEQNKALIELVKELLNASNTDKWVDVYNKARITLKQI